MNIESMEHLPNEVWLLIFEYLHQVDILHGFLDINQRFQCVIQPYIHHIDLSNVSFTQYNQFCDCVLPKYHDRIHSLKLENHNQFKLFKENILKLTNTLESLTLDSDDLYQWKADNDQTEFYLQHLKDFKKLTDLQFIGQFTPIIESKLFGYINQISTLETLTILTESINRFQYDKQFILQMPNLKVIKINLIDFTELTYLLNTPSQIQQIYISIRNARILDNFDTMIKDNVSSLQKLHVEFGTLYTKNVSNCKLVELFACFRDLFHKFQINLQSFTLIMSLEMFENETTSFDLKQFTSIPSFQYLIHTLSQPKSFDDWQNIQQLPDDTYLLHTSPRPVSFIENRFPQYYSRSCVLNETSLSSIRHNTYYLTINSDYNATISFSFKFVKLRKLAGYCLGTSTKRMLFHTIVLLSPNLKYLRLTNNQPKELREVFELCNKSLKKIILLECGGYGLYSTFFVHIGEFMPHLKYLKLFYANHTNELSPKLVIDHIQQYCSKLKKLSWINLQNSLQMNQSTRETYEEFIQVLKEKQKSKIIWFTSEIFILPYEHHTNVWF
ncbi:hypothetical protein I4U23_015302 [Adineta vaga]|nr:hypothetical protein I4U23_015302 [Adineta vaga]